MSESVHILVVRTGGLSWALPMSAVEQTFDLRSRFARRVGSAEVVCFRGQVIELISLGERLGVVPGNPDRRRRRVGVRPPSRVRGRGARRTGDD